VEISECIWKENIAELKGETACDSITEWKNTYVFDVL
jgi:hypothetical protein